MLRLRINDTIVLESNITELGYLLRFDDTTVPFDTGKITPGGPRTIHTAPTVQNLHSINIWNISTTAQTTVSLFYSAHVAEARPYKFTLDPSESAVISEDIKVYTAHGTLKLGYAHITISATAPVNPTAGDLWVDIS